MNSELVNSHSAVRIFSSDSVVRHPGKLVAGLVRDIFFARQLALLLAVRDIKAQYRQSLLGLFWAFVPPVALAIGLSAARQSGAIAFGGTSLPYPLYVMFSVTLWQTFALCVTSPLTGLHANRSLLTKVNFPREAVLMAEVLKTLFNFGIQLLLIAGMFIWYRVPIGPSLLLAPFGLMTLMMMGLAVGLILAPIGVLYSDVGNVLPMAMNFWLLITPVFYPTPPSVGIFGTVVAKLNPATPLLVTTRELATSASLTHPTAFLITGAMAIVMLGVAALYFRVATPMVVERWSS